MRVGMAVIVQNPGDVHVVTQHMAVAPATLELTGRALLGLETDASML